MSNQYTARVEQFYELYAKSDQLKSLSEPERELINHIKSLPNPSEELQVMLSRFLYVIRKKGL
ncbi:MAG: hypothetical protein AAGG51_15940 [Cyanobacteria bacterium P01_G01_bin.54]